MLRDGPQLKGKKLRDEEVYTLLTFVDLDSSFFNKPGSELSVGQAQSISPARTLAKEPDVIHLILLQLPRNTHLVQLKILYRICIFLLPAILL